MKLETFFEKFEMFADAPNAIPAMRELVLTLAVQGKLVAQDPEDEPAGELCAQLQKLTSGAKQKTNSISEIELPFEIPACWKLTHLDTVTKVFSGNAFQSVDFQKELGIRVIKITNVGVRDFKETHEFLPVGFEQRFSTFLVQDGDILMALTRPYILDGLKVARCPKSYNGALLNQRVGAIQTAKTNDISDFLYLYLCSEFVLEYVIEKSKTLNQPNLNIPDLRCLPLPLPPLAEQKRIVAKVDELMTLCDRLEAQQQEREEKHKALSRASLARFADAPTPANLQFIFHPSYTIAPADVRKSILALAPRGQLVKQRESEGVAEPNSEVSFSQEELPYELPAGWVWKRLGDLVEFIGGSQPPKSKFIYEARDGYTRFIQIRDFKSDANLTFIPTALANRPFKEDDVMIGRYGPPVFQILRGLSGTYNVALMKAEPISKLISKDFLFYLLLEPRIQDRVIAESDRTAGQSGVRKPLLHSFIVAIPPLAEQRRIVAKVEELMKLVDALETQLAASRATAANLLAAIVAELTNKE